VNDDSRKTTRLDAPTTRARFEFEALVLEVLCGPDRGERLVAESSTVRLGSAPENDLVLTDPSISGRHAELVRTRDAVKLRDLGSTNGTFLGPVRVREATLPAGPSTLRLGETEIRVTRHVQERAAGPPPGDRLGELVGSSEPMKDVFATLRAVAPSPMSVLLTGETGTGKEAAARTLHALSGRRGLLVVFDAATTDPASMRADLFGHEAGAYTGATGARPGLVREADGGTLFLDELGELPVDLQPALLRLLEAREVTPLGADLPTPVDVRVVAATHRDLPAMVQEGTFRGDLLERLATLTVELPPLRARMDDVPVLADHLAEMLGVPRPLGPEVERALAAHPWPGNVRELRNALTRAAVLAGGEPLTSSHLDLGGAGGWPDGPLQEVEEAMIRAALARAGGERKRAAALLGISPDTLRRRLARQEDS
jgi:DNA-binding NtrC family response regulator